MATGRAWNPTELDTLAAADELAIAPARPNGTLWPYTTIWVVRVRDDLYVRCWRGRDGGWFRRALKRHEGRIRAGGIERNVTFEEPGMPFTKLSTTPTHEVRPMRKQVRGAHGEL